MFINNILQGLESLDYVNLKVIKHEKNYLGSAG